MPTFGERFKELRLNKKMKQEELINDFNKKFHYSFTKSAVSQYENDKRIPEIQALNDFSNYFGVSVDYLLGKTNNRNEINIDPIYRKKLKEILECFIENGYDPDDITKEEFKSLLDTYMKFKGFKKD